MEIVTISEMRQIETEGFEAGTSYAAMVCMVGRAIAKRITEKFPSSDVVVVGLIGKGNNGADTIVALSELKAAGRKVAAVMTDDRHEDMYCEILRREAIETVPFDPASSSNRCFDLLREADVILDGIFGIGFRPPLPDRFRSFFKRLNARNFAAKIVAVDCASGIHCDTGEADEDALTADETIAIHAVKIGQLFGKAAAVSGKITTVRMDLAPDLPVYSRIQRRWLTESFIRRLIQRRPDISHKGAFGMTRVFGGCENYLGAVSLSAEAAYRIGAGLVEIISSETVRNAVGGRLIEVIWDVYSGNENDDRRLLESRLPDKERSAWLVGPGFGTGREATAFLDQFFAPEILGKMRCPVIDADALNYLAGHAELLKRLPPNAVLTPHPGEMARLCGCSIAAVQANRIRLAEEKAREWNAIVVLKGAYTCIAAPHGATYVAPFANAVLAKAGSGDVLSGSIAGLIAQGYAPLDAALAAVWFHGRAGDIFRRKSSENRTMIASEIARYYGQIFAAFESNQNLPNPACFSEGNL